MENIMESPKKPHEIFLSVVVEPETNNDNPAFQIVLSAHQDIEAAYDNITSESGRHLVRSFIATNPDLLHVESAVNEQCRLAMAGDSVALGRVSEGMNYWKQLIMRQVRQAWNQT